ncbi:MASE1 domain-containing protein [Oryzomonas sagensis]
MMTSNNELSPKSSIDSKPGSDFALQVVIIGLAYFTANKIALLFPDAERVLAAVWPAAGVGLAALLLSPRQIWPKTLIVIFAAGNSANLISGRPLINSLCFMTANCLESYCSAWLITRWCGDNITFSRVKEILALICASTLVNAFTATVSSAFAVIVGINSFQTFWSTWWVSDGLGLLIVTPAIVTLFRPHIINKKTLRLSRLAETACYFVVIIMFSLDAFNNNIVLLHIDRFPFLLFAVIAWGALRLNISAVAGSILILAIIAATGDTISRGPLIWGGNTPPERLLNVQMFIGILAATGLFLSASFAEARKAVQSERETGKRFRALIEQAPEAILIFEVDQLMLVDANPAAEKLFDCSRNVLIQGGLQRFYTMGQSDGQLIAELIEDHNQQVISGKIVTFEQQVQTAEGRFRLCEVHLVRLPSEHDNLIRASFIDITERKRVEEERIGLEKQLLHAQKLESLGVLAGGIAHDFNNLLMAIMGNADMALMRLSKESPAVENLRKIEQASARAADLAKQMLAYSGKGKFVVEPLDLNNLVEEMWHMLEVSISKKAVLRLNPYHPLPAVEADATQIRQIIMNLVINASEAIGDKSGIIAVTTGCLECNEIYLQGTWLTDAIHEGLYVYLEIADTGCGMDKETQDKIFDPFFTTKFAGRGLGMAAVLGIVRGHKGAIKVYSELNKGTTFKILLPASDRPAELFNGDSGHDDWHGEGTVLLVDDEETVRGIGTDMLKGLGFEVITANDGHVALDKYRDNPGITLVILDLTMPHMDGEQCFRELRQLDSKVKVIMSSGFSEQEVAQKFAGKGLAGFIQKPYKLSMLREEIKKVTAAHIKMS